MAYQKKYYYSFKQLHTNALHTVELWQNTEDSVTAEEIDSMSAPFIVEMPELKHKFQVVRGKGCELNLLSNTNMKFFNGLYHIDPQEFMVKHYIDGSLNFLGYLNSELYTESYDTDKNYSVQVTGNDGFALMGRFQFIQSDGTNYEGIKSKWELLDIIFSCVGLPYSEFLVSLSTTFDGYSGNTDSTILHESFVNCANFYDEDGEPMTLREVLESILAPYGAFIAQVQGNIVITDIHTITTAPIGFELESNTILNFDTIIDGVATYKRFSYYSGLGFELEYDTVLNSDTILYNRNNYLGNLEIIHEQSLPDVGFAGTGQTIEISGGVNKQVVSYSPYIEPNYLNFTEPHFTGLLSTINYGTSPYRWDEHIYSTSNTFISSNNGSFADYVGSESGNSEETDSYLKIAKYDTNGVSPSTLSFKLKSESSYIMPSDALLKVEMKAYFRTVEDLNGLEQTNDLYQGKVRCKLFVGDRQYYRNSTVYFPTYGINSGWTNKSNTSASFDLDFEARTIVDYNSTKVSGFGAIDNQWITLKKWGTNGGYGDSLELRDYDYLVPLHQSVTNGISGGILGFEIYDFDIMVNPLASTTPNYTEIKASVIDIRIKDIKLSIVDSNGDTISDVDIEYISKLDKTFKDEGDTISLTTGTERLYIDRGKIMKLENSSYSAVTEWTRAGQTHKIEELLLCSVASNYKAGFITISGMKLRPKFELNNILTDPLLADKRLMINQARINYWEDYTECSLVEVSPDDSTITLE